MGLVLLVVIGVWLLNGRDPGTPTGGDTGVIGESSTATDTTSVGSAPASPTPSSAAPSTPPATDEASGLPLITLEQLPPEAIDVIDDIYAGGPFAYDKDGSTFGNYEGILPDEYRGYYREYTVDTPGSRDRGARRIVEGESGEFYWTDDHYESFSRIAL